MSDVREEWLDVPNLPDGFWEKGAHLSRYRWVVGQEDRVSFGRVADAACGMGYGTQMLRDGGLDAVGFDCDPNAIALAVERYGGEFHQLDVQHATFRAFKTLVCFEILEHLVNPWRFIEQVEVQTIFASAPIIPTKEFNPFHKHDFTEQGFIDLIQTSRPGYKSYSVVQKWDQWAPDGRMMYRVVRAELGT